MAEIMSSAFLWKSVAKKKKKNQPLSMIPKHTIGTSVWVKDGLINSCGLKNAHNSQSPETERKPDTHTQTRTHTLPPAASFFSCCCRCWEKGLGMCSGRHADLSPAQEGGWQRQSPAQRKSAQQHQSFSLVSTAPGPSPVKMSLKQGLC